MHQIFYIDSEEEITSVIDQLRKSKASENFCVLPKKSVVMQSIVNLKLLKKEAEKLKKQVVLVTQDQQGVVLAQKVGILTRPTLDGLVAQRGEEVQTVNGEKAELKKVIKGKENKRSRLENIGSNDFYGEDEYSPSTGNMPKAIPVRDTSVLPSARKAVEGPRREMNVSKDKSQELESDWNKPEKIISRKPMMKDVLPQASYRSGSNFKDELSVGDKLQPRGEEQLESLFQTGEKKKKTLEESHVAVSGKFRKIFVGFIIVSLILAAGIFAYLFVPGAEIVVYPVYKIEKRDLEITAKTEVGEADPGSLLITARILESEESLVKNFPATGSTASSNQKTRGTIVIYNEYSDSSQPLVATTRFLTEDGKLFRLVEGIVVPGMAKVGGELKPGVIEAEVIADQPGEEYNIDPAKFSIPGFEGGPKYEKFHAVSEKPMTGGGSAQSGEANISQQDLDNAKSATEGATKVQLRNKIKKELDKEYILLSEAMDCTYEESSASVKAGDMKDNFDYTVKAKAKVFIFPGEDVKNIFIDKLKQSNSDVENSLVKADIEYGQLTPDFEKQTLKVKAHGEMYLRPDVNLKEFRENLLGKKEDQIKEVLENYPQIKRVEINFWPKFISEKIPQYKMRVDIRTEDSELKK